MKMCPTNKDGALFKKKGFLRYGLEKPFKDFWDTLFMLSLLQFWRKKHNVKISLKKNAITLLRGLIHEFVRILLNAIPHRLRIDYKT
jgi:hypothetical protein